MRKLIIVNVYDDYFIFIIWLCHLYYKYWYKRQSIHDVYQSKLLTSQFPKLPTSLHHYFILYEILYGFIILIPLLIFLSFIIKRITIRYNIINIFSKLLSSSYTTTKRKNVDDYNTTGNWKIRIHHMICGFVYLYTSEIFVHFWTSSITCIPYMLEDEENNNKNYIWHRYGYSCKSIYNVVDTDNNPLKQLIMISLLQKSSNISKILSFMLFIRLIFILIGIYIGQSMIVIALTGSIATGKSTVGNMLLLPTTNQQQRQQKLNGKFFIIDFFYKLWNSIATSSVRIIDSDRIGHEILLPPSILSMKVKQENKTTPSNSNDTSSLSPPPSAAVVRGTYMTNKNSLYTINPKDSVYNDIIRTFGEKNVLVDDDNQKDKLIDRRKLGNIIFQDNNKRMMLNHITHPKIIRILIQQVLYGALVGREKIVCIDIPLLFESNNMIMKYFYCCIIVVVCTNPVAQYQRLHLRNPDLSAEQCNDRINSQYPIQYKIQKSDIIIWNEENVSFEQLQQQVHIIRYDISKRLHGIFQYFTMFNTTLLLGFILLIIYQ